MAPAPRPRSMKKIVLFFLALVLAGVATATYYLHPRFESDPPDVTVSPAADAVGVVPIEITVSDKGTGLRSVTATLSAGGIDHTLVSEQYSTPVPEKKITVEAAKIAAIKEGPAVLRVVARDATDQAGNTREMRLSYELKNVKYRKSTIAISDSFLENKVRPLLTDVAKRQGSAKEVFVAVNKDLRKQNEDRIAQVTSNATPTILWKGAFKQLSNSKGEANFAHSPT